MNLNKTFVAVQDASRNMLALSDKEINQILLAVADAAINKTDFILSENQKDLERMPSTDPKYDRLKLTKSRLQDIAADSSEAFHTWFHDRDRCGGHPWEVCRGGNSTHVDLRVMEDMRGYFLYLAGAAWNRTMETVKFYLALTRANIPVYLAEAKMLADRLAEEEKIGIVPEGVLPAYCGSWFPNEHIIDYMNLPSEDREKFLPFCTWYEERPAALAQREET